MIGLICGLKCQVDHKKLSDNKKRRRHDEGDKKERIKAREIQKKRFADSGKGIKTNSEMNTRDMGKLINLSKEVKDVFKRVGGKT